MAQTKREPVEAVLQRNQQAVMITELLYADSSPKKPFAIVEI